MHSDIIILSSKLHQFQLCIPYKLPDYFPLYILQIQSKVVIFTLHTTFVYFLSLFKAIHIFISISQIHDLSFRFLAEGISLGLKFIQFLLLFLQAHLIISFFQGNMMTVMLSFPFILLHKFSFRHFFNWKDSFDDGSIFG